MTTYASAYTDPPGIRCPVNEYDGDMTEVFTLLGMADFITLLTHLPLERMNELQKKQAWRVIYSVTSRGILDPDLLVKFVAQAVPV